MFNFLEHHDKTFPLRLTPATKPTSLNPKPPHIHSATMDDSKMQIMRQVQQEAAMQNARMLVEVFAIPTTLN
jgi:hypothetical protein